MKNKTLNPTTLFGKNGEGTPWEEATGAENSKRDMEKVKNRFYCAKLLGGSCKFFSFSRSAFLPLCSTVPQYSLGHGCDTGFLYFSNDLVDFCR